MNCKEWKKRLRKEVIVSPLLIINKILIKLSYVKESHVILFTWNHNFPILVDNHILRTSLPFSRNGKLSLNSFVVKNSILLVNYSNELSNIILSSFFSPNQEKLFFSWMRYDKWSEKDISIFKPIFSLEIENTPFLFNNWFISW